MQIQLKRAYDAPEKSDGHRILVDRVWPRGIAKTDLLIDDWLKDVAPSAALRKWFNHEPAKWTAFKRTYFRELDDCSARLLPLRAALERGPVTLIFAARDEQHNNAVALKDYIESHPIKE